MVELQGEQKNAHDTIIDWYATKLNKQQVFKLGGYAGTGKTYLLSCIRKTLLTNFPTRRAAFCCYTGKASSVLRKKLVSNNVLLTTDYCGTIHSLIYVPVIDPHTKEIIKWERKKKLDGYDLIVIDEGSMVDEKIFDDLLIYSLPILVFGDHFQLPPVKSTFNLMYDLDFKLETIYRQEIESPIIKLSMMLRDGKNIPYGVYSNAVAKVRRSNKQAYDSFINNTKTFSNTMILCSTNQERISLNKSIRKRFNMPEHPSYNDRVICLKNNFNAVEVPVMNGTLGTIYSIQRVNDLLYDVSLYIDGEDKKYHGYIYSNTFNEEKPDKTLPSLMIDMPTANGKLNPVEIRPDMFDFGYCLTVHKSQGSQAYRVMVIEGGYSFLSKDGLWFRWMYTAITRSEKQLLIVS